MTNEKQVAAKVADKLLGVAMCPNCGTPVKGHADNSCILNVLIDILRDRGNKTGEELHQRHVGCNIDALWDDMAAVLNKLEDGYYSL
jgi:hypothetical protein